MSVGRHPWNGGELILSRWDKPVEIVPWERVADDWVAEFRNRGVEFDIVPPKLLPILAERGVEILPPHKGMGKACKDAYETWKNENPDGPRGGKQAEGSQYLDNADGVRFSLPEGLKRMDDYKERREREIKNIIIDNTNGPKDKKSALATIPEGGKLCHNNDQNVEIRVTRKAARHGFRRGKESEYASIGEIERIIGEAVKIGELPVDESEKGSTDSVSIYYCPVNVDGTQHSARMVVKQYYDREGAVLDEFALYDLGLHEKTSPRLTNVGSKDHVSASEPVSGFKVKELIYSTQEYDKKLLGIGSDEQLKFSLTEEQEALNEVYADAVESGDQKKVARMVKDAVKSAMPNTKAVDRWGKPRLLYHGTPQENQFYEFNGTIYLSSNRSVASEYTHYRRTFGANPRQTGRIMPVFVNLENPLEIDANRHLWRNIDVEWSDTPVTTRDIEQYAKEHGYDGVIIKRVRDNMYDNDPTAADVYIAFSPEQVKSAGPTYEQKKRSHFPWDDYSELAGEVGVTYDNDGNLIPLSERFNLGKKDIRFSLSEEQREAQTHSENFKNWFGDWERDPENASKVVGEDGRPLVVYRGGEKINVFDRDKASRMAMYGPAFYATPSYADAQGFGKERTGNADNVQAVYLDIRNPWVDGPCESLGYPKEATMEQARELIDVLTSKGLVDGGIILAKWNDGRARSLIGTLADAEYEGVERGRGEFWHAGNIVQEALKELGYDGVVGRFDSGDGMVEQVAAFDSHQIKSATENNGEFSRENPDIRFSLGIQ